MQVVTLLNMTDTVYERNCAVFRTVDAVGDAWSWMVLREVLLYKATRFEELQRRLGAARSTLVSRLRQLQAAQVLVHDGGEYWPTARGEDFLGCLLTAMRWGERWCHDDDTPLTPLIHTVCGNETHAELLCTHCQTPVQAHDVTFDHTPAPVRRLDGDSKRQRMPGFELLERNQPCAVARTLQVIGDKWSALIVQECFLGTHYFDQFQQRLSIASNILSHRLSRLVELDILRRSDAAGVRRHYRLTTKGLDLYPVPLAMLNWGEKWLTGPNSLELSHRTCGNILHSILTCAVCRAPLTRADLLIPRPATV